MSPKRKPSETPLTKHNIPKKRRLAELVKFSCKPDQFPADLTDLVDDEEKKSRLCLICKRVQDVALVPSPCKHGQVHTGCAVAFNILQRTCYCLELGCGKDLTEYIYVAAELQLERHQALNRKLNQEIDEVTLGEKGKEARRGFPYQAQPTSSTEVEELQLSDRSTSDKLGTRLPKTQLSTTEEHRLGEIDEGVKTMSLEGYTSWEIERRRQLDIEDAESLESSE